MSNEYGIFEYRDFALGVDVTYSTDCFVQDPSWAWYLSQGGVKSNNFASFEFENYDIDNPKRIWREDYVNEPLGLVTATITDEAGGVYVEGEDFSGDGLELIAEFSSPITAPGITIDSGNVIKSVTIKAYNNGVIVNRGDFSAKSKTHFYPITLVDVDKVVFEFYEVAEKFSFFKIFSINYGLKRIFDDSLLLSAEMISSFPLLGDCLPYDTLNLDVIQDEVAYLFQKNQSISYSNNGDLFQKFFVEQVENSDGYSHNVICYDVISMLETEFLGGLYTSSTKAFGNLVREIFKDLPVSVEMSEDLWYKPMYGYIPICSKREALRFALLATNTRLFKSGEKIIAKEIPLEEKSFKYDESNIVENPQITENSSVKAVTVRQYNYTPNNEEVELYNWYVGKNDLGNYTIKFSQPAHDVVAYDVIEKDGQEVVSETPSNKVRIYFQDVNYCLIDYPNNVVPSNKICFKGKQYSKTFVDTSMVNENAKEGVEEVVGLELYSDISESVDFFYSVYTRDSSITFLTMKKPEIGECYNILGKKMNVVKVVDRLNGIYEVEAM